MTNLLSKYRDAVRARAQHATPAGTESAHDAFGNTLHLSELNALAAIRLRLDKAANATEGLMLRLLDHEDRDDEGWLKTTMPEVIKGLDELGHPVPALRKKREDEKAAKAYAEVGKLLQEAFPKGIVLDLKGGELPVLRCGPYRDREGMWGVVLVGGRREVRSLPDVVPVLAGTQEGLEVRGHG